MKLQSKTQSGQKKLNPREVLEKRRSYCDEVHDTLEQQGVNFFNVGGALNIDTDYLTLPHNITEVPSSVLGEYLNAYTQQKVYIRTLLGYAEMYAEEARQKYMTVSEGRYHALLETRFSETAKEREVNTDPNVREAYDELADCRNKVRLLSLNIESIEDIIFMLSREVSRRTGDFNDERRDHNVGRM